MTYLDFKSGRKYEVLKNIADMNQGYYQIEFQPGEIIVFRGTVEMIHESYTILMFERGGDTCTVKFSVNLPEPDWSLYFRGI